MTDIYLRESIKVTEERYIERFGGLKVAKKKCINIGAGSWEHPCWTNLDLPAQTEAFKKKQTPCIHHNIVDDPELPFEDNTLSLIYTSHVIEHLPSKTVQKLFDSVYQKLETEGFFRVVTGPDSDTDWDALQRNDRDWWYFYNDLLPQGKLSVESAWLNHLCSPRSHLSDAPCEKKYDELEIKELINRYKNKPYELMDALTENIEFNINYPGDHLSWWNADKLVEYLKQSGFSVVYKSHYGQSHSYFMRDLNYFDLTYPQISLYVEAIK